MKTRNPFEFVSATYRNSPWIVISVSVHVIAIAILAVWYIAKPTPPVNDAPLVLVQSRQQETIDEPILPPLATIRDFIPKMEPAILDSQQFDLQNTIPITEPPDPNDVVGEPDSTNNLVKSADASTSIGLGGKGHRGTEQGPFSDRGIKGDLGPPGNKRYQHRFTDKIVLDGLRWLARHQNADGSWTASGVREHCSADNPCPDPKAVWTRNYDEGLTGMALLAYLGAGFTNESKDWLLDPITQRRWQVGEVVKNGLRWLKNHQNADGSFSRDRAFLYNDALGALALTEAYGLTQNRYWMEPAQRGIDFIQNAQRPNPSGTGTWGWRYASRQEIEAKYPGGSLDETGKKELFDADLSVTGWCVMALKSAQLSNLRVSPAALEGALAFTKWVSLPDGQAGYLDPKSAGQKVSGIGDEFQYHTASMSALAMCVRAFSAHDASDPFLEQAARRIAADLPAAGKDGMQADYYYWYYGSLALHQFDGPDSPRASGKYWGPWNKAMVEALSSSQSHDSKSCHDGGWLAPDRWCHAGGPLYATAINVLTAEVYYRYANAFGARRR
jgi:hypothetical protein